MSNVSVCLGYQNEKFPRKSPIKVGGLNLVSIRYIDIANIDISRFTMQATLVKDNRYFQHRYSFVKLEGRLYEC